MNVLKERLYNLLNSELSKNKMGGYYNDNMSVDIHDHSIFVWFNWQCGSAGGSMCIYHSQLQVDEDWLRSMIFIKGVLSLNRSDLEVISKDQSMSDEYTPI